MNTISAEKNSTIVFPLPIDLLTFFMKKPAEKPKVAAEKPKVLPKPRDIAPPLPEPVDKADEKVDSDAESASV